MTAALLAAATRNPTSGTVVFCRRAVDWNAPDFLDRTTHFNAVHPLRTLLQQWQQGNPGIPFHAYRLFLHQLARRTWEDAGARVLLNHVAMDGDVRLSPDNLRALRQAEWIIPIDDDDWLAPDIGAALRAVPAGVAGVFWKTLPLHVRNGSCHAEAARSYDLGDVPETGRVVLSCAYAISRSGAAALANAELAGALLHHGKASRVLLDGAVTVAELDTLGSVHLRHQATAGSAMSGEDRTLFDFVAPPELAALAPWALRPLGELRALHAARAGGA